MSWSSPAGIVSVGDRHVLRWLLLGAVVAIALTGSLAPAWADPPGAPPEVLTGDRMSVETRFSRYFYAHSAGQVNVSLAVGDPVVDNVETTHGPVPGPFAGTAINCRSCHLIDEVQDSAGQSSYADFARHSPTPAREDGATTTPRNSPPLVNALVPRPRRVDFFLHFDGEFASPEALVKATLTGRNFGWLPEEHALAVAHIANVIRNDDGYAETETFFGSYPYGDVLRGTAPVNPPDLPIPESFQIDVDHASDDEVLDAVARLVTAYMRSLVFAQDAAGNYSGTAYDAFLAKNALPRQPRAGESALTYGRRLRRALDRLDVPSFVTEADGTLKLHDHAFRFGPDELTGLRIFLKEPRRGREVPAGGVGNCIACHAAPDFTDFSFHNTGATQEEYDGVHGAGSFAVLDVPSVQVRNANPDAFLPASPAHPGALSPFRAVATATRPGATDLGLWNIYLNPDVPDVAHQQALARGICRSLGRHRQCYRQQFDKMLEAALGLFKTPGLRDLGHSEPYLHTGRMDTLQQVIEFYRDSSIAQRAGTLRNGAQELGGIALGDQDIAPLVAFLEALDEDYR